LGPPLEGFGVQAPALGVSGLLPSVFGDPVEDRLSPLG
jgi:hypothetical protein